MTKIFKIFFPFFLNGSLVRIIKNNNKNISCSLIKYLHKLIKMCHIVIIVNEDNSSEDSAEKEALDFHYT